MDALIQNGIRMRQPLSDTCGQEDNGWRRTVRLIAIIGSNSCACIHSSATDCSTSVRVGPGSSLQAGPEGIPA
jgi:hypothetical protein